MAAPLRAVVVGAGWAGEGHTRALQWAGVEVVAICARQPGVVRAVADRLGVADSSTDWRRTVEALRPDIVAVATPASLRGEVVEAAVALGAHLYCDKPLAATAAEARRLYDLVQSAGVKHAFGATHRYDPSVAWLAELVRDGAIGAVLDVEYSFHVYMPPLLPWTWWSTEATGGGFAGQFPHILGILSTVIDAEVRWVTGTARKGRERAPVVPGIHDMREVFAKVPTPEEAAQLEWRPMDIATSCSALLRFAPRAGHGRDTVVTLTATSEAPVSWPPHGMRLLGTDGALIAEGYGEYSISRVRDGGGREPLPVPQRLIDALPQAGTPVENKWAALARDFLADVRGEARSPYLTFQDGWRYQEVFDAVITNRGWYEVPMEG